jgi:hypothetical protein
MIILWTFLPVMQGRLIDCSMKSMNLTLVISVYTTLANLWMKNPYFNLKSELGLMLFYSWISMLWRFLPSTYFC